MPAGQQQGMIHAGDPPKLAAIREQIEQKIPQEMKHDYDKVYVSAQRLMFAEKTHPLLLESLDDIKSSNDPAGAVADEVVSILKIIKSESQETANDEAIIAAAIPLMTLILEFGEKSHGIDVTDNLIAMAAKETIARLMQESGVTPEQIDLAAQEGGQPNAAGPARDPATAQMQPASSQPPTGVA